MIFKKLKRKIEIKDAYFQLIQDISFDYDGYDTVEDLKKIIDELNKYAYLGSITDDKTIFYRGNKKKYNIIFEEVKDE